MKALLQFSIPQHIEEISVVKEELQEKIYSLEGEIKQVKFERDNKESQIVALKEQLGKRAEQKVFSLLS
jgi:peptidoglycan hydrolase CwlO-like protein